MVNLRFDRRIIGRNYRNFVFLVEAWLFQLNLQVSTAASITKSNLIKVKSDILVNSF